MKKYLLTLLLVFTAHVTHAETAFYVVKMHAEWCGVCKIMEPKMPAVKAAFKNTSVKFLHFDFTNETTTARAKAEAKTRNISTALTEHRGRTGFLAIINAQTGENIGQVSGWLTPERMIKNIKEFTQL